MTASIPDSIISATKYLLCLPKYLLSRRLMLFVADSAASSNEIPASMDLAPISSTRRVLRLTTWVLNSLLTAKPCHRVNYSSTKWVLNRTSSHFRGRNDAFLPKSIISPIKCLLRSIKSLLPRCLMLFVADSGGSTNEIPVSTDLSVISPTNKCFGL